MNLKFLGFSGNTLKAQLFIDLFHHVRLVVVLLCCLQSPVSAFVGLLLYSIFLYPSALIAEA